jgi:hypothetical protein
VCLREIRLKELGLLVQIAEVNKTERKGRRVKGGRVNLDGGKVATLVSLIVVIVVSMRGTQAGRILKRFERGRKVDQKVDEGRGAEVREVRKLGKRRRGGARKRRKRKKIQRIRGVGRK